MSECVLFSLKIDIELSLQLSGLKHFLMDGTGFLLSEMSVTLSFHFSSFHLIFLPSKKNSTDVIGNDSNYYWEINEIDCRIASVRRIKHHTSVSHAVCCFQWKSHLQLTNMQAFKHPSIVYIISHSPNMYVSVALNIIEVAFSTLHDCEITYCQAMAVTTTTTTIIWSCKCSHYVKINISNSSKFYCGMCMDVCM